MTKLNHKQQRFCEEYVLDFNGTQAAIRAGYSATTAKEMAYENLNKPHIASHIDELCDELLEGTRVKKHVILQKLMDEAENMDNTGSVRVSALTALGKYLGLFTEKVEHSGQVAPTYTSIRRVAVYLTEDGDLVEADAATGEHQIVSPGVTNPMTPKPMKPKVEH